MRVNGIFFVSAATRSRTQLSISIAARDLEKLTFCKVCMTTAGRRPMLHRMSQMLALALLCERARAGPGPRQSAACVQRLAIL